MNARAERSSLLVAEGTADPGAPDWAPVLGLLDDLTGEDTIQFSFRRFADQLAGTSYESISLDEFVGRYRLNILALATGVRQRRIANPLDDMSEHEATGRLRALSGVELSDMVRITLVAQSILWEQCIRLARRRAIPDELIVEFLQYFDSWATWTSRALITGFQEAAIAMITRDLRLQDRAVRRLLGGGLTPVESGQAAADCGLDMRATYHVLRVVTGGRPITDVRRALVAAGVPASERALLAPMYGDVCVIVDAPPTGDMPFLVGVSPPVRVSGLDEGFRLATRSAEAARQMSWSGFVTMRDVSIAASLTVDLEVVSILRQRYVQPFADAGAAGQVILDTVAEFLRHQRNVAETGQAMYVHVNTVRYRIERFEAITGCSLKDVRTITEVWWILHAQHG